MHKNTYVLFFAAAVTVTCSLLLASAATLLRDRQQENIALDMRKNILESAGLINSKAPETTREQILRIYDENITSHVVNLEGNLVEDKQVYDLDPKKDKDLLPLFYAEKNGKITSYIIPISGKGLWSTIYGYLALEPDVTTVMGITFYKHGETPGLGGEIEKDWFKRNFIGKKIFSPEGKLVSIGVVKGKVEEKIPEDESYHYVDGISGSTLTGNGLTNFLKEDLKKYEPFLRKVKNNEVEH